MSKKLILISVLVATTILGLAFVSTAYSPLKYTAENNYVPQKRALDHARVFMLYAVMTGTPGLEEWKGATIDPNPVVIYDINGKKLFYEFAVMKNGKMVGTMKVAANRIIGHSVVTFEVGPRPWDPATAIEKAKEIVQKRYPGKIISTKIVCYSYPKIGVMITLIDQKGEERNIIIDATDYSIVFDNKSTTCKSCGLGVWSFYEHIPLNERPKRIAMWERDDKFVSFVIKKAETMGINIANVLSEYEFNKLRNQIVRVKGCSQKTLDVPLYGQTNEFRCAVATA
jgi:uncharacterized membrane protein YkoI